MRMIITIVASPEKLHERGLGKHGSCYLTQGIKTHYHSIEHHHKMRPSVETLHVALTSSFAADLKDF
jgi:hypothetical protein